MAGYVWEQTVGGEEVEEGGGFSYEVIELCNVRSIAAHRICVMGTIGQVLSGYGTFLRKGKGAVRSLRRKSSSCLKAISCNILVR